MVAANQAWNLVNFRGRLIAALLAQGYRVMALAPDDDAWAARLRAMGCLFAVVPMKPASLSPLADLRTLWRLTRLIRRHRPAAWLSWTIKPNVYGSFAAGLAGVPAFPNVSGLGTAFIRRNLLTLVASLLYRRGFARAPVVFFQNADDRALFVGKRLVSAGQARLLPGSGIDLDHFAVAPRARHGEPPHFVLIARLLADKGVREFAAAARIVGAEFPGSRFTLVGPLGVANRTAIGADEVAGWLAEGILDHRPPQDDIRPVIADADWIVLPSYREGLSRVLLEAAAMGRPIVTTDVPGCRDLVREGVNGFLAPARDGAGLAGAMARAAQGGAEEWQAMAQAGRAMVAQEFSAGRVIALYLAALDEANVANG